MIDKYVTALQSAMVSGAGDFFKERRNSTLYLGAYVVMPLTIGFAGFLDYIKLPLAIVESVVKGIFAGMLSPISNDASQWSYSHFKNSRNYIHMFVDKLTVGWALDLECMFEALKQPKNATESPASFCGKNLTFCLGLNNFEKEHPSICEKTK
ncbi:MAG: hypothetical protein H0W50_06200 [Parachlamydiaceae bacterium]|nr:hypothetical protein [Parachlamydiaceae bacterium]